MTKTRNSISRVLFSLFNKTDFRDKNNSGKRRLIGTIVIYLFSNAILSYNFYRTFDSMSFIILSLTASLFLTAFIVLSDFDNIFIGIKSLDSIRSLPIEPVEIFRAKFTSAYLFLLLFMLAACFPQLTFYYFYERSLTGTLLFFFIEILFCYSSISLLLLFYISALILMRSRASIIINILQVCFFAFVFYSTTLSSKYSGVPFEFIKKKNILDVEIVNYLPQTFFAKSSESIAYLIVCIAVSLIIISFLYFIASKQFFLIAEIIINLSKGKRSEPKNRRSGKLQKIFAEFFLSDNLQRASFALVRNNILHSRFLRTKYLPVILMPLVIVVIGLIANLPDLIFFNNTETKNSFFNTGTLLLSPSVLFTLIISSRILISNTKIADSLSSSTGWIYETLPVNRMKSILTGAIKFIYLYFILPLLTLIFLLLILKAPTGAVLLNILYAAAAIYFVASVNLLFDKTMPFTLESSRYSSSSKFIEIFLSIVIGIILFLIQILIFQNAIFVFIIIAVLLILSVILNRI